MGEGGIGIEEGIVKPKESRELLGQYKEIYGEYKAAELAEQTGYDNGKVTQTLTELAGEDPEKYQFFVSRLRTEIKENEEKVKQAFDTFLSEHPSTPESILRKEELSKRVIKHDSKPSPELATELQDIFPSGNFLVHGTSVEGGLSIAGDSDGAVKSVTEIRKGNEKFKGKGDF